MRRGLVGAVAVSTFVAMSGVAGMGTAVAADPVAGDSTITIAVTDDLGGQPVITFERVYAGVSPSGTPVYVYAPVGWQDPEGVVGIDPNADPDPTDADTPCGGDVADYTMTQAQLTSLGDELADHILAIDEAHYGEAGDAGASDDALVVLAYNAFDEKFYDCSVTTYTAGYFAPEFITEYGMNAMVIDSFDWANRLGDQAGNENGQSFLYEGVLAHELEHLLMNYSDPGELSWVDEGLADFAVFLNGYPVARLTPDLPAGVPPGDLPDPVGRRPGELRRLLHVLPVPLGAGRRQRRRHVHAGRGVRRRRR